CFPSPGAPFEWLALPSLLFRSPSLIFHSPVIPDGANVLYGLYVTGLAVSCGGELPCYDGGPSGRRRKVARIVRALAGHPEIPADFPLLVSESMAILEPAFAWLLELATIPGRSHAA